MTRIDAKFESLRKASQKAFIAYITAGDPNIETTLNLVLALEKAGTDIIELGVPFSDPIADGPVIQRGTERALAHKTNLREVLRLGAAIRQTSQIPLLLFSYYNPLLNHGLERLASDCAKAGFDGILATDLTVEEADRYSGIIKDAGLNTVFLVAPTSSPDRIKRIAESSTGFLYAVSRTGVTGERQELDTDLQQFLRTLRRHTTAPIAVGFGISRPEHVRAVWQEADGAVVGSAIVREIEKHLGHDDLVQQVSSFAKWLTAGL